MDFQIFNTNKINVTTARDLAFVFINGSIPYNYRVVGVDAVKSEQKIEILIPVEEIEVSEILEVDKRQDINIRKTVIIENLLPGIYCVRVNWNNLNTYFFNISYSL